MANESLNQSGEKIAKSAEKMGQATERVEDSADRRTVLAADRTLFAAERTYAAWMRTGLFALASGVGSEKLLTGLIPKWLTVVTASILVIFSAFCFVAGAWRELNPGAPPPRPDAPRLSPYLLCAFGIFLALVAAAVLVGLWFGRASDL
jgi:putative membrane protein